MTKVKDSPGLLRLIRENVVPRDLDRAREALQARQTVAAVTAPPRVASLSSFRPRMVGKLS